jgi:predicted PurR-regulated permease PerM
MARRGGRSSSSGSGRNGAENSDTEPFYKRRSFKLGFLIGTGVLVLLACGLLRGVFGAVAVSLVLAYIFEPVIRWMEGRGIRRWLAVTLIYVLGAGVLALFLIIFVPKAVSQTGKLYNEVSAAAKRYGITPWGQEADAEPKPATEPKRAREPAADGEPKKAEAPDTPETDAAAEEKKPEQEEEVREQVAALKDLLREHADKIAVKAAGVFYTAMQRAYQGVSNFLGFVVNSILVVFYTFFFMLGFRRMQEAGKRYLPAEHKDRMLRLVGDIDKSVSSFFRGRLIVSLISATVTSVGLWLSGIDYWLLIGIAAGVLGFIPFVGVIVPLIPAVAFAILSGNPWPSLIGVAITFTIVQAVVEPVIGSAILSKELKLHPVTLVIALLVGGKLFGMFGAVMSVPLAAVAKILGQEFLLPPLKELAETPEEEQADQPPAPADTQPPESREPKPDEKPAGQEGGKKAEDKPQPRKDDRDNKDAQSKGSRKSGGSRRGSRGGSRRGGRGRRGSGGSRSRPRKPRGDEGPMPRSGGFVGED